MQKVVFAAATALLFIGCSLGDPPPSSRTPTSTQTPTTPSQSPSVPTPVVATPTFSPAAGSLLTTDTITLEDSTPGATIFYTTDESDPGASSAVYSAPFHLGAGAFLVKAIATKAGMADSVMNSAIFAVSSPPAPAPTPTPSPVLPTNDSRFLGTWVAGNGNLIYYLVFSDLSHVSVTEARLDGVWSSGPSSPLPWSSSNGVLTINSGLSQTSSSYSFLGTGIFSSSLAVIDGSTQTVVEWVKQ